MKNTVELIFVKTSIIHVTIPHQFASAPSQIHSKYIYLLCAFLTIKLKLSNYFLCKVFNYLQSLPKGQLGLCLSFLAMPLFQNVSKKVH